jgi:hypothetical protein
MFFFLIGQPHARNRRLYFLLPRAFLTRIHRLYSLLPLGVLPLHFLLDFFHTGVVLQTKSRQQNLNLEMPILRGDVKRCHPMFVRLVHINALSAQKIFHHLGVAILRENIRCFENWRGNMLHEVHASVLCYTRCEL